MIRQTGGRIFFAVVLAAMLLAPVQGIFAEERLFSQGQPPTEAEVKAWADHVKAFRESVMDGENGRFSAVRIDGTSVFLLDTRQGHLWVWTFGEKGSFTAYQGQLVPGLKMGDIVGASAERTGEP
jgi:hypothetical protein